MTNTKLFLFIGTSLSLIPSLTSAQCVATQDCATLGYTETSCSGGSGIKCPFGNKWACFKSESEICNDLGFTLTCTGSNQTGGGSTACNGKYNYCSCADGYVWQNGTCVVKTCPIPCTVGTLYYSDGTCSDKLESSKTLLGVVIFEKTDTENGWIMTVNPVATGIEWGGYGTATKINDRAVNASCSNTQKLVSLGNNFAAANTANNYKPNGTPSGKSWCLPSYELLNNLNNSVNFAKVNNGISTAQGKNLGFGSSSSPEIIWSSSENDYYTAWSIRAYTNTSSNIIDSYKDNNGSVRPVMAF